MCEPLSPALHHIFNLSLKSGFYPTTWKITRVTPIPKSSNKSAVEQYRPIAILSAPAKVFEYILHQNIYYQVEKRLTDCQHGFRRKRSVNTNLLVLVDYISSQLDQGSQVDVIYFDFCKAFDRINNDILLMKLCAIGFSPNLLRLFADYLRDRRQFVRLGIYESSPYHTRSGVGQGSVLGPFLFLLMINDLPTFITHAHCLLYADDIKLYKNVNTEADCIALQADIDAVYNWSVVNKMEFNPTKCFVVSFGRKRHPITFDYNINGNAITRSTLIKDLGVTFDQSLTFHNHIINVAMESFKRLGFVLRNARDFQDTQIIKLLYSTLVRSKLEASSCVWNPHEKTYSLVLEKVQKAFLRFLFKFVSGYYPYMYPTKYLLGCLGYNLLETRRSYDQMICMIKICRSMIDAPDIHSELMQIYTPNNYLRNRRHKFFATPVCRTVARAMSPVPRVLNQLNAFMEAYPQFDIFNDEWKPLVRNCLNFSENYIPQ